MFHVTPPSTIIVSLPDNSNQVLKVPADTKFKVNGREVTAFELRKGMKIEATIVTDSSETVMSQSKKVTGIAPPPAVLPEFGVLLIQFPAATLAVAPVQPVEVASAEPIAATLPRQARCFPWRGSWAFCPSADRSDWDWPGERRPTDLSSDAAPDSYPESALALEPSAQVRIGPDSSAPSHSPHLHTFLEKRD